MLLAISVVMLVVLLWYYDVHQHFSLSSLKDNNHFLKRMLNHNYYGTVVVYILMFVFFIGVSIPGSAALTLLGGYMFGVLYGIIYSLIGSVLGSTSAFLLFRYGMYASMNARYGNRIAQFKTQMERYGVSYLLMLHFFVVVPYLLINALAALSGVSFITFLWTTIVGGLPIIIVYSFAGRQLSYINTLGDIFSPTIIVAFVLLIALSFLPIMIKKYKHMLDV